MKHMCDQQVSKRPIFNLVKDTTSSDAFCDPYEALRYQSFKSTCIVSGLPWVDL